MLNQSFPGGGSWSDWRCLLSFNVKWQKEDVIPSLPGGCEDEGMKGVREGKRRGREEGAVM